jgi:hypothetical protein
VEKLPNWNRGCRNAKVIEDEHIVILALAHLHAASVVLVVVGIPFPEAEQIITNPDGISRSPTQRKIRLTHELQLSQHAGETTV